LLAALGYTAANICLRAVSHCDPVWVSAVKSVPTVVLAAPLLLLRARRGQGVWPHRRALVSLILAALAGQLIGNVVFQWSLGIVGLALAVPVCLVAQIAGSAVLGRIFLQESITPRMAIGVVMLVAASTIFSFSAEDAYRSVTQALWTDAMPRWKLALSVGAVCLSGLSYAWLGLVIRRGTTPDVPIASTLFIVCIAGMISLGILSPMRIGWAGIRQTAIEDLGMMILAGLCNFAAFYSLTKALQLTSLLYVNALGASQAMLAAIAGVALFQEAASRSLEIGIALSVVGILLMSRTRRKPST
jgi:drug/metabolite transporter (DMT)-like permease